MGGWTYDSGQFNLYCDVCKRKIKAEEAKHRWDGFIVCPEDWEPRQPQDFVKAKIDKISVPFSRPTENTSTDITYGMYDTISFIEDISIGKGFVRQFDDVVNISEVVVVARGYALVDTFTVTDSIELIVGKYMEFTDPVSFDDQGYLYMYDYTTPFPPDPQTYFAEDYVGLLQSFT